MIKRWWPHGLGRPRRAPAESGDGSDDHGGEYVTAALRETERLIESHSGGQPSDPASKQAGKRFDHRSAFYIGFMATVGVFIAYGLVHVVMQLSTVITYIVVAGFLSLGLEPIVGRLARRRVARGWAVVVVMIGVAVVLALLGWLIVPTIVGQISDLVRQAPGYLDDLQHNSFVQELNERWDVASRMEDGLKNNLNQHTATTVFGGVLGAGKAFVDGAVATFTVLVLTLYFLAAMPRVKAAAYQLVPRSRRTRVVYLGEEISRRVGGYVLGQLCVATINGVLAYIMLIVLDLPFPAVLAVTLGLLALIPIVGTLVGGVLVTLVALTSGWVTALIVIGYYIAYHALEAYVLTPRIMHRAVEVPAVLTIVAILAGGTLLGILGALIAIPVAAGLMLIYKEVVVPRQENA